VAIASIACAAEAVRNVISAHGSPASTRARDLDHRDDPQGGETRLEVEAGREPVTYAF